MGLNQALVRYPPGPYPDLPKYALRMKKNLHFLNNTELKSYVIIAAKENLGSVAEWKIGKRNITHTTEYRY